MRNRGANCAVQSSHEAEGTTVRAELAKAGVCRPRWGGGLRRRTHAIRIGCRGLKKRLSKWLERIRGNRAAGATRGAALPRIRTGWTVHHDVALRHRSRPIRAAKTPLNDQSGGTFKIRLAGSHDSRRAASVLVQQRYATRGYRTTAAERVPHLWTFAAYDEGRLAGTVSLRLDSPAGLAADELYRAELDAIRSEGRRVCEFTRLAVDTTRLSQPVLAGLFHTVYLFARRVRSFDFVVIEVNPRHVGFYRRSLGFDTIGAERHNPRVEAPAVLMGISFVSIAQHLHRQPTNTLLAPRARSLYAYGFTPAEEAGVLRRLRALDADPPADVSLAG